MANILNLFKFIESKRNQYPIPLKFKLINNLPLTKDDLNVKDLYLTYMPIKSLPDNLNVKNIMHASYSLIDSVPNNLNVGGNLYLHKTPLAKKVDTGSKNPSAIIHNFLAREQIRKMIEDKGGFVKGDIFI